MHLKHMSLAHSKFFEHRVIHKQVPMAVPKAPNEVGEVHIDFVILHLRQGFVQLALVPSFQNAVSLMAGRTHVEKIEQQVTVLPEPKLPIIGDFHRLIDEQVPRVGAMPIRSPQEAGMGDM
jgi:hypothetical protein